MSTHAKTPLVGDIASFMEEWAPSWTAEEWDRVGLLVGEPSWPAARVWVALELTPELLARALKQNVNLLLTHHPPLFKPLPNLRTDRPLVRRLLEAASRGLALFAAHTNLDVAPGGVNDALAARLGLGDLSSLEPAGRGKMVKVVVFTPPEAAEAVAQALFTAGAGRIGNYRECAFAAPGVGSYVPPPDGRPYRGAPGRPEQAPEQRLETILPAARLAGALAALGAAHPYEEPAVDVYPLTEGPAGYGLGRVGRLDPPLAPAEFAARAARELGSPLAALAGAPPERLSRVAVVGGSGGDYLAQAAAAGAGLLVTGEARYHAAEAAADLGLGLLTLGHFQTEQVIVEPWARRLSEAMAARGFNCEVVADRGGVDPWRPAAPVPEE
ncbi:MAG: Nif3-like dinuclear metal center hexameric protein [Deltaproteobacteria bacterium]|nr:Nif3-like dinuclear metal center hexameric protein [Deltaproteobacteria bacterium]